MTVQGYPAYRESGAGKLGQIPDHWAVKPVWAVTTCNDDTLDESTSADFEFRYIEISDVNAVLGITNVSVVTFKTAPSRARRRVKDGDVIISTVRTYLRAIASIDNPDPDTIVSTGFAVFRPRAINPRFMALLCQAEFFISDVISRSVGVSYPAINASDIARLRVPVPPIAEQSAIAAFLDRETSKIDALVIEQERLIALLKEKRQAVISHAVTKGLNPNAPMKDSGVPWLGEVPAHWSTVKFGKGVLFQEGPGIMADDFRDDGVPLLRISGVQTRWVSLAGCNYLDPEKVSKRWNHFRLLVGDLVISGSASMGVVSEVDLEAEGAVPYTGLIRLQPRPAMSSRDFVRVFVLSAAFNNQVDRLKAGATIQHFGPTHLAQMFMALPPLNEQGEIAEYVDSTNESFDVLSEEATRAITLLRERRAALISAAVTGKIDVRGTVPAAQHAA